MALQIPEHLTQETKLYLTGSLDSLSSLKDNWYSVPDPALKGVSVPCPCGETVEVVTGLSTNIHTDPYNDDEAESRFLYSKPPCFIIVGKPGCGKTTLARKLATEWSCQLINSTDLIQENMDLQTEIGTKCKEILLAGQAVSDEMVLKMVVDKVNSPEVAHHGYVLDDLPCLYEGVLSVTEQIEMIKSWKLRPDFIINIRIPDKDIEQRRLGQKVDPENGQLYTQEVYAPEKPAVVEQPVEKVLDEDEEEAVEEGAAEEDQEIDEGTELPLEVIKRLVKRPEDMQEQVTNSIDKYKNQMLRILEEYMGDHDQQYLVEMDGNESQASLYKQLMQKLLTFNLQPAALVRQLVEPEEEEIPEDMETDELLRLLAARQMVAPRYRWRRSRWGRYCPVALWEGNLILGKPEFAVSFLDKMYVLSSEEAMNKFMKNPRTYLIAPQPKAPCKIAVIGGPFSGKTTLCHLLASRYGAKIFDIAELTKPVKENEKQKFIDNARKEATDKAIQQVKAKLKEKMEAEAAAREEERQARLAIDRARKDFDSEEDDEDKAEEEKQATQVNEEKGVEDPSNQITPILSSESMTEDQPEPPITEPDVDENHPDVVSIVNLAVADASTVTITLTSELIAEVLENAIKEWEQEMRSRNVDGPLYGSWVLDAYPTNREQWNAMVERNLIPDELIVLGDVFTGDKEITTKMIQLTTERYCIKNRDWILSEAQRRQKEKQRLMELAQKERDRLRLIEEEMSRIEQEKEEQKLKLLMEKAAMEEAAAEKEKEEKMAYLHVNQVLWDTLAGEVVTRRSFHEMGIEQPRGPSFITLLAEEFHDYSELYAKLDTLGEVIQNVAESDSKVPEVEAEIATEVTPTTVPEEDEVHVEQTELEYLMLQPEAIAFRDNLGEFDKDLGNLIGTVSGSSHVEPHKIDIAGHTPEKTFQAVVDHIERFFHYTGWEVGAQDLEEEEEDLEAEDAEEEGGEEEEDANRSVRRKFLGDSNYFDPVPLKETDVLVPGNPEIAAVYRERVYYFYSNETKEKFLENPSHYVAQNAALKVPPVRLLILGPKGSGKTLHGRHLAEKLGVFHISFRERLQELIIAKTKRKIGPEYQMDEELTSDEEEDFDESGGSSAHPTGSRSEQKRRSSTRSSSSVTTEQEEEEEDYPEEMTFEEDPVWDDVRYVEEEMEKNVSVGEGEDDAVGSYQHSATVQEMANAGKIEEESVELTEAEEAIKAYLEDNEPLPNHVLDNIIQVWWKSEPFKSTGFILEGFPRTTDEVKYLQESGLMPDAAVILQVSESEVIGRLLPPKLEKWRTKREKRLAKKTHKKEKARKKKEEAMAKRREELVLEREERKKVRRAEKEAESFYNKEEEEGEGESSEEEEEEEEEDIDAILAEEFEEEEEEEEEDEENEEDAIERMKNDFNEIYDDDTNRIVAVEEALEEILIPRISIDASRRPHIIRYILSKKLKPYNEFRHSIFERVYPISEQQANLMLQMGYKYPSRFGRWDPVKLKDGDCIQPAMGQGIATYPCIHRSYIYFFSSRQSRQLFMQDPMTYLKQPSPKPVVPIKMAIIGPPKSGKSTIARRFVEDYGVKRLSIGEAMRTILATQKNTDLAKQMFWHLSRGRVVPDNLQIQSLEVALLDMTCQTRGYVLDGYPMVGSQIQLMRERSIIPVRVIELELESKEVMVRGLKDRMVIPRPLVLHDSAQILAIKLSCYHKTAPQVRDWYQKQHQNYQTVNGNQSKWWVWDNTLQLAIHSIQRIQDYLQRIGDDEAAGIAGLCITPEEFEQRVGVFGNYCPVSLAQRGELVDCSVNPTLEFAAEFRGHYYKMAGKEELEQFLSSPEKFVPPLAPRSLPAPAMLPRRITKAELQDRPVEILGYCPVTYLDGNMRYDALIPGCEEFMAEYMHKVFLMQSQEKLLKFMKLPEKYSNMKLPHKLPPKPEELPFASLPMLGFMEQTCAIALVKALTAAGNVKPKYPFISSTRSALIYIAYHLKAFNPKSSPYIRKKYKQKLQQFEETCQLINYLGNNMTARYRDPNERPKDFDTKLETFFALRGVEPTPTWIM
ncbi:adenylate kinase 9-like isoform X2 [Physella acuta]|uniref:adenylate kinase 9-like isoform X2 n=1 Tax=Physella acuta TaxID=109671 RepID=UPI0027DDEF71|nr:adenylate kinase 9-like isoform X2 [Physella acuta]